MKYSTTPLVAVMANPLDGSLSNLSRKQRKQLQLQMEREKKEFEKSLKTQQTIKSLQELQFLLHQVHPNIVQAPKVTKIVSNPSILKAESVPTNYNQSCDQAKTAVLPEKDELVDVYLGSNNQQGEEESKDHIDEDDYVKDFTSVLENVENGYYYL